MQVDLLFIVQPDSHRTILASWIGTHADHPPEPISQPHWSQIIILSLAFVIGATRIVIHIGQHQGEISIGVRVLPSKLVGRGLVHNLKGYRRVKRGSLPPLLEEKLAL